VARYEREKWYEKWAWGLTSKGKWPSERESTICKAEKNMKPTRNPQQTIATKLLATCNAHSLHTHGTNNQHNVRECLQVKNWWSENLRTSQAHLDFKQKRELKPMQHNEQETLMNNNDQRKVASAAINAHDNTDKYGRNWCWVGGWQQIPKLITLIKVRPHDVWDFRFVQIVMPPSPLIFLNEPSLLVYDAQVWIKNGMVFKFIKSNKRSDLVQMSSKID
jgi:hypothetical protein